MKRVVTAACMGLAFVNAATAAADSGRLADFSSRLTSTTPGAPTGMKIHLFLRAANDPNAKPSPLRTAVLRFADGLRFDTGSMQECTASDDQIHALGPDACEPASKLTVGRFTADLGFGPPVDPFVGEDHVFNGPGQIIEIITGQGNDASPGFDRVTIDGSTLTAHPPSAPGGPPDGEAAIRSIDFTTPVKVAGGRSLITNPPACPADHRWRSSATFGFADGSKDTVGSSSPCTGALRLSATPELRSAGRRLHVVFSTAASDPGCVARVKVRFAGRAVRTDRNGRAAITTKLGGAPGARRATATKPGCRTTRAPVRVSRAVEP